MSELTKFDHFLSDDGPAALVIREPLMPVEGADGVVFPATFASGDNFPGGYNVDVQVEDKDIGLALAALIKDGRVRPTIDMFPNAKNVCLIDSVGAQANRIEPLFAKEKYAGLVPQVIVKAGEKAVNILEAGHRAGDAIVRCSELQKELQEAFKAVLKGNAEPLAKIAPTSLVFGVWDSRDTQAKLPRLVASSIRAFNVTALHRSAQYNPPIEYVSEGLIDADLDTGTGKSNPLSVNGFKHNPATWSHGGVIATGGIRRDATLGLSALRLLSAGDEKRTLELRRYILGLSLVAFTATPSGYLRQGCLLVADPDKPREFVEVHCDGKRVALKITHDGVLKFAHEAAKAFGIGDDKTVAFDKERAKKDIKGEGDTKATRKKAAKKADVAAATENA